MRTLLTALLGAAVFLGFGNLNGEARAQINSPTITPPRPSIYPLWTQRYYYYSPYDSGYYTVFSPGYRSYYAMPNTSPYYQPNLPRYYTPSTPVIPGPESSPGSPSASSGTSSYPSTSGGTAEFPGPSWVAPPKKESGDYPSSPDYYIPSVRRDGSVGPYWYYKADLERFYADPRGYEVNKLDIDREYFNPHSPHFFSPTYRGYYHFPGTSIFYTRSSTKDRR